MNDKLTVESLLQDKEFPIHIIGGGGVGMSGLAALLHKLGFQVSASDQSNSAYLQLIAQQGVRTWVGSQPNNILPGSITFYSTAIPESDDERKYAVANNWPSFRRHPLLNFITKQFYTIAICGTHGKTTTSAWLTYTFLNSGKNINALIGGKLNCYQSNFFFGNFEFNQQQVLVIEADESDESFEYIDANLTAITNVELDHPDHFTDILQIEQCFFQIIATTRKNNGKIFLSQQVASDFLQKINLHAAHYSLNTQANTLLFEKHSYELSLQGEHNIHNSSMVAHIAHHCQLSVEELASGLNSFTGVSRRMELLLDREFHNRKIKVIDDYAHHPTEVEAVLKVICKNDGKIIYFWEPHRISRFLYFLEDFLQAFSGYTNKHTDFLMLPIFTAGENPHDFDEYVEAIARVQRNNFFYFNGKQAVSFWNENELKKILNTTKENITFVFLGAGLASEYAHNCSFILENLINGYEK